MKWKNIYRIITFTTAAIISAIVIYLNLLSHKETNQIYEEQTKQNMIELKKDFVKDTVDNIVKEIGRLKESKQINYRKNTEARRKVIEAEYDLTESEFVTYCVDKFTQDEKNKMWTAVLWNEGTGEIIYHSADLNLVEIDQIQEQLKSTLPSYAEIGKGEVKGIFGVSQAYIDEIIKTEIEDTIRSREYSNGTYIWVNEVINYEGGDHYAICRINLNYKDSEGQYLSTKTKDIKGNFLYLEELEGVKNKGELFFTYYFKKLNSSEVSQKISYAKLYKDYNWIIGMGVHLDDIEGLITTMDKKVSTSSNRIIVRLVIYIFMVLLSGFMILYFIEKKYVRNSTKYLQKKINVDTLTNALSRSCGELNINRYFKQYKRTGEKPAIMMIDVDNFKQINDRYGHGVGDIALIEIVHAINYSIRSYDQLIRWGGDEFVVILIGLREENTAEVMEKILNGISSLEIPIENGTIKTSISIGLSYFEKTDIDYNEVIKRADDALYKSKELGKNIGNVLL